MKSSLKGDNMERRNSDGVCVCVCIFYISCLCMFSMRLDVSSYGIGGMSRVKSFGSFKRDFKLDDVCDFVQTGVQVSQYYIHT